MRTLNELENKNVKSQVMNSTHYQQCITRVSQIPCALFRRHLNRTRMNKNKVKRDMTLSVV